MQRLTIGDWVQILSSGIILAGLIFVYVELQQGREVAEAQLVSDNFALLGAHQHALLGEGAADVIAKACLEPESLTPAEIQVLSAHFQSTFMVVRRLHSLSNRTGFFNEELQLKQWTYASLQNILSTPYGHQWWQSRQKVWANVFPKIGEIAGEVLENIGDEYSCHRDYSKGIESGR